MNKSQNCECVDCKCDPCNCGNEKNCCNSKNKSQTQKTVSILIVIILIVWAYIVGVYSTKHNKYNSYNDGSTRNRGQMMQMSNSKNNQENAMIEHCKMMPEMAGCKNNTTHDMMSMSMNDMGKMLEWKTGDELNKAFLEGMIPHHQWAVEMAKYLEKSNKPELVKLGTDIIAAQTKEIEQMKKWMKDWWFENTGSMMIH